MKGPPSIISYTNNLRERQGRPLLCSVPVAESEVINDTVLLVSGFGRPPRSDHGSGPAWGQAKRPPRIYHGVSTLPKLADFVRQQVVKRFPECQWNDRYTWYLIGDVLSEIGDDEVETRKDLVAAKHLLAFGGDYSDDQPIPGARGDRDAQLSLGALRAEKEGKEYGSYHDDIKLRRAFCARIYGSKSDIFKSETSNSPRIAAALLEEVVATINGDRFTQTRIDGYAARLSRETGGSVAEAESSETAPSPRPASVTPNPDVARVEGSPPAASPVPRRSRLARIPVREHPIKAAAAVLAVIGIVVSSIAIFYWRERSTAGASTPGSVIVTQPVGQPTSSTRRSGPTVLDNACANPNPSDRQLPPYELCVVNWCQGIVTFPDGSIDGSRIQIKLRPRIVNNTLNALDVSIWKVAALRLLVSSSDLPGAWRPPKATAGQGDDPFLVEVEGQRYWSVAPDLPRDVDLPDPRSGATEIGFASFWKEASVAPSSVYPPPIPRDQNGRAIRGADGRFDQDGDLVFQIPSKNEVNNSGYYGLALIDRAEPTAKPLAVAWLDDWGLRLNSNEF